jgi:tripartite-type tricarboxylate transporter receptor subunit TctC
MNAKALRLISALSIAASGPFALAEARAQGFPERTISMIVPFPAGGGTDTLARPIADKMKDALGRPVIIENKGGASSNIGNAAAATSPADGHTLLINSDTFVTLPLLFKGRRFGYDPLQDFACIGYIAGAPMVIAVSAKSGIRTLDELTARLRADPAKSSFANVGTGTPQHLAFELLAKQAKFSVDQVRYRGGGPAVNDVTAGHVLFGIFTLGSVMGQLESGSLTAIALFDDQRHPAFATVPTIAEAGYPKARVPVRYVLFAPKGTPGQALGKLADALTTALKAPTVTEIFKRNGYTSVSGDCSDAAKAMRDEHARWSPLIDELKLTIE